MALLIFELHAKRFIYNRGVDYSQRRLCFEAFLSAQDELTVLSKGPLRKGEVTFTTTPHESLIATLKYIEAWEDRDNDVKHSHSFSLGAVLANEAFDLLMSVDLTVNQIYLTFDTDIFDSGLTYGYAPDGSEKYWDLEKEDPLKATSFSIAITAKEKAEEEPPEQELEERLPQHPTVVTDLQLLRQLRAIWWTIMVLGSLILIKLSW
ncbi:hypothetical protein GR140_30815 (plasmid) [Pseudomonas putida]|uniref:hypothetical protein n=1 Tax=Pseudomonas putida TaxID=303 RepID=UPI001BAF2886|nr:hypothetical protein [Pseudomonas putida]QUG93154.1 hypothetical protein GR140_30815 [Pseudomonas putida]